jgi:hypothetical protein
MAALAAPLQLAPPSRQSELSTTNQPTRPITEQPIGFTQLGRRYEETQPLSFFFGLLALSD